MYISTCQNMAYLIVISSRLYSLHLNPVSVSGTSGLHIVSRVQDTTCLLHEKQKMTMASPKKIVFLDKHSNGSNSGNANCNHWNKHKMLVSTVAIGVVTPVHSCKCLKNWPIMVNFSKFHVYNLHNIFYKKALFSLFF